MMNRWIVILIVSLSSWAQAETKDVIAGAGAVAYLGGTGVILYVNGSPNLAEEIQNRIQKGKALLPKHEIALLGGRFEVTNGSSKLSYGLNSPEDFERLNNKIKEAKRSQFRKTVFATSKNVAKNIRSRTRIAVVSFTTAVAGVAAVFADDQAAEALDNMKSGRIPRNSHLEYVEVDVAE